MQSVCETQRLSGRFAGREKTQRRATAIQSDPRVRFQSSLGEVDVYGLVTSGATTERETYFIPIFRASQIQRAFVKNGLKWSRRLTLAVTSSSTVLLQKIHCCRRKSTVKGLPQSYLA